MIIIIISREKWGEMQMSKHKYAIELARQGHQVYFLECPDRRRKFKRGQVEIQQTKIDGLKVISFRLFFPLFIKYKVFWMYKILLGIQLFLILRKIDKTPDLIWSFDTEADIPISLFNSAAKKIYMPVDGPYHHKFELINSKEADIVVSVSDIILKRHKKLNPNVFKVSHGIDTIFFQCDHSYSKNLKKVGYAGSLLRNDIDFTFFKKIINTNPDLSFEFFGEYHTEDSTIHLSNDVDLETIEFIDFLKKSENVKLHGALECSDLAEAYKKIDCFILAYNENKDNSHKILEYLSTGKVVISSYLKSIDSNPHIEMLKLDSNADSLFDLFKVTKVNYAELMSETKIMERIESVKRFKYSELTSLIISKLT